MSPRRHPFFPYGAFCSLLNVGGQVPARGYTGFFVSSDSLAIIL